MSQNEQKEKAVAAALAYVRPGIILGIGTGSTVDLFIDMLEDRKAQLETIVSSSNRTSERLQRMGIEVSPLSAVASIDLYIDGADEATEHLHLIKGGGGALTREKVLAGAARKFLCIVDSSKLVSRLGEFPLPIEVIPMATSFVARELVKLDGLPELRAGFVTDNGNHILDVRNLRITNPVELETRINQIPGVVTVGLFAHRPADILLVGGRDEVRVLK